MAARTAGLGTAATDELPVNEGPGAYALLCFQDDPPGAFRAAYLATLLTVPG